MPSISSLRSRVAAATLATAVLLAGASGPASAQAPGAPSPPAPGAQVGLDALPPGPGRETMVRVCSACHAPQVAAGERHDAKGWAEVVQIMAGRGATASDAEFDEIINYLATAFPAPPAAGGPSKGRPGGR